MRRIEETVLQRSFFARDVVAVARDLIGATLTVGGVGGRIVETEAYHHEDPASHSFAGPTQRNAVMFGPAGHAYIYLSYGIHWCLNAVAGPPGEGNAVLIRALEPLSGLAVMGARRGGMPDRLLCAGPGRLCQALGLGREQNGLPLDEPPFRLAQPQSPVPIATGPRIGISKAADRLWRFGLAGSRFLSQPFPLAAG
jgi:DNA-3-methyladenine glycosylase